MDVHIYMRDESDCFIQILICALQYINIGVELVICC